MFRCSKRRSSSVKNTIIRQNWLMFLILFLLQFLVWLILWCHFLSALSTFTNKVNRFSSVCYLMDHIYGLSNYCIFNWRWSAFAVSKHFNYVFLRNVFNKYFYDKFLVSFIKSFLYKNQREFCMWLLKYESLNHNY